MLPPLLFSLKRFSRFIFCLLVKSPAILFLRIALHLSPAYTRIHITDNLNSKQRRSLYKPHSDEI